MCSFASLIISVYPFHFGIRKSPRAHLLRHMKDGHDGMSVNRPFLSTLQFSDKPAKGEEERKKKTQSCKHIKK